MKKSTEQLRRRATQKRAPRGGAAVTQQKHERQEARKHGMTTVSVRFASGQAVSRVFTYKVRTPHPFKPGDPVVVDSRVGMMLAFIIKVDAKPNLDGPFTYRWLRHRVVELHPEPMRDDGSRYRLSAFGAEGDA